MVKKNITNEENVVLNKTQTCMLPATLAVTVARSCVADLVRMFTVTGEEVGALPHALVRGKMLTSITSSMLGVFKQSGENGEKMW